MGSLIVNVSIPHTNRDFFDYYADAHEPCIGARVWVPFRKQTRMGVVVGKALQENVPDATKSISSIIDDKPLLSGEVLALCHWISSYYQSPLSEVIPLALPKKYRNGDDGEPPTSQYYQLITDALKAHELIGARAPRQHQLIDYFVNHIVEISFALGRIQ